MTSSEIRNEIARLKRQMREWLIEGRLDSDVEADMQAEISDLEGDLRVMEHPEDYAPTGGLNEALFVAAFGRTPEEEFAE